MSAPVDCESRGKSRRMRSSAERNCASALRTATTGREASEEAYARAFAFAGVGKQFPRPGLREQGYPDLRDVRRRDSDEARRGDADDPIPLRLDAHTPADRVRAAAEAAGPGAIAQHSDRVGAGAFVLRREPAADLGREAQGIGEIRGDRLRHDDLARALDVERGRHVIVGQKPGEHASTGGGDTALEFLKVAIGAGHFLAAAADGDDTVCLRDRERLPEQLIHHAENGRIDSDSEAQADHRSERVTGVSTKDAHGVVKVLAQVGRGEAMGRKADGETAQHLPPVPEAAAAAGSELFAEVAGNDFSFAAGREAAQQAFGQSWRLLGNAVRHAIEHVFARPGLRRRQARCGSSGARGRARGGAGGVRRVGAIAQARRTPFHMLSSMSFALARASARAVRCGSSGAAGVRRVAAVVQARRTPFHMRSSMSFALARASLPGGSIRK